MACPPLLACTTARTAARLSLLSSALWQSASTAHLVDTPRGRRALGAHLVLPH
eukprot:CAMPEP_0115843506 /NCGR_PEP_ID=MMETSP0287-20121206/8348_1 /TAXON_ID=412157 /ORGANISM="Chrysochromulina rotalis, Strain UIO044" /LENGTH=52 /DNA_ID=CAMNT_0003297203 /DNA_START=238 /DNA_END=393 /DNA_ORIENTATION=+